MDISRLAKMHIGILAEDTTQTPNPEKLVDKFINTQVEQGNMVEDDPNQEQNAPDQNQPQEQQTNQGSQEQQPPQDQQPTDQNTQQQDDNPYDMQNSMDDQSDGQKNFDMPDVPDNYDSKDDSPKLKILQSLSDKEYKLNNIRCHEQFKELYKNVQNTINNNIIDMVTKNEKQRQVVTFVHNNLSKMLDDLNTYIVYKFSDIYEDNILAYITFLKRYQIAMKLLDYIASENRKETLSKK